MHTWQHSPLAEHAMRRLSEHIYRNEEPAYEDKSLRVVRGYRSQLLVLVKSDTEEETEHLR